MRHRHDRRHTPGERHSGLAPPDLVREDFARMTAGVRLRAARTVEEELLMQSVEGHAHEGHLAFRGHPCVNTTMDDIVESLGRDPRFVTRHRQSLIDDIAAWARRAAAGKAGNLLMTDYGECLLGIGLFRQVEVEPEQVLRGFYLGAMRDDLEVRGRAKARYGIEVGGGSSYVVDVHRMHEMGFDARSLAKGAHEDQLPRYREQGLIVAEEGERPLAEPLRYLYIRHRTGAGTSDDAAVLAAGKRHGPSAAIGAFLADAIDTLEKYTMRCADQDCEIAETIARDWPALGVSEDELLAMVYLCAMPDSEDIVPDCSLRHALEIDRNSDQTAFESHLAYIQGRPRARMKLDHAEVDSEEFYQWFEGRWASAPR